MAYASLEALEAGFRKLKDDEKKKAEALLEEAKIIIDAYNADAKEEAKALASCLMVRRVLGDGNDYQVPIGATQGTVSALGYSQTWTMGNGGTGELYIGKLEKKLLCVNNKLGTYSPLQEKNDDKRGDGQTH